MSKQRIGPGRQRPAARSAAIAVAVLAVAGRPDALRAQANEQWYVTPSVGTSTQRFGTALVVADDLMVVGAPYEDTMAADAGAVDVFRWDDVAGAWTLEQQLFASDAEAGARFGASVAVDADVLVVGSPDKDTTGGADAGQLYVFRYDAGSTTWSQEQKLKSSVGLANDQLGAAVAVHGAVLLAGAPRADTTAGIDSGVAVAYRYKNSLVKWVEEKQLVDGDAAASDYAGTSVAFDGTIALVGSPGSFEGGQYGAGSIGVWSVSGSTWSQTTELTAPTPQYYAGFGSSIQLEADLLAATAPAEDETTLLYDSGAAYLLRFVAGSFVHEARITSPVPLAYEAFGSAIAIRGDLAAVGAQMQDVASKNDCGAVHLFRRSRAGAWVYDVQLGASDFLASDHLGVQVAINDEQVLAAADGNDTASGSDWGVVYGWTIEEIELSIVPPAPLPGDTITFSAFRGTPDEICLIAIEDVAGTPLFLPLLVYIFAADCTLTFDVDAPDPAYGLHVGMRAWKISPRGPVVVSELAYMDV